MKDEDIILKLVACFLFPFVQLFALYVIMHGKSSPGGGFQGGVILATSIILYSIVFGRQKARDIFPEKINNFLTSLGVLIYALVGIFCMIFGGNYLEYNTLPFATPQEASKMGILLVEIGIGITVFSVMTACFLELSRKK